jgi:DNA-binding response OmpR family regulator
MPDRGILIIEDDTVSRMLIQRTLEGLSGYTVTTAGTVAEGLALFRRERPSIVVTDWVLPDTTGREICRTIRREASSSYVYVIVLTANAAGDASLQALHAGADDFIAKPFRPAELKARVLTAERILELESALHARVQNLESTLSLLKSSKDDLAEAERLDVLSAVSVTLSHRLNNSLTGILGLGGMLLSEDALPPTVAEVISHIVSEAGKIADTISRLANVRKFKTKPYAGDSTVMVDLDDSGSVAQLDEAEPTA